MLSFINSSNFWLIAIALAVAFGASIITFRLATSLWISKPTEAKWWLACGIAITALGACFIYVICIAAINDKSTLDFLTTALGVTSLMIATLLVAMLDLLLRNKKLAANQSKEHSSQMVMTDALTQLPNRHALLQQLEAACRRSDRSDTSIAVAFVDIDNFKQVNSVLGYSIGDEVLQQVAKKLVAAVRGCDKVARIGGDQFIALIEEIKSDEDCITIVERMLSSIREVSLSKYSELTLTASIGVAIFPRNGGIGQLMSAADTAMRRAKKDGKNNVRFFDAEMALASEQLLEMQYDLKNALANDELKLHFQIKIDSVTREPVGAEALLHWQHPVRGLLYPTDFMQAAERFGLSNAISAWVIEESCRTLHHLKFLDIPFSISINLSYQQLKNVNLVNDIVMMLQRFDLPTSSVIFEISEYSAIRNEALLNSLLDRFNTAEIKIAINDFGSQPSSLAHLKNLKVNELKLDQHFINDIDTNQKTRGITQAIIELAHVLELNVVAEGVETEEQRKILAYLGCDQMQGILISPPLPEERLIGLLKNLTLHFEETGQLFIKELKKDMADLAHVEHGL